MSGICFVGYFDNTDRAGFVLAPIDNTARAGFVLAPIGVVLICSSITD